MNVDLICFSSDTSNDEFTDESSKASTSQIRHYESIEDYGIRRKVIIDVANVAHTGKITTPYDLCSLDEKQPDAIPIFLLVNYFVSKDFAIDLVVTNSFMHDKNVKNSFILQHFERLGIVTLTRDHHDDVIILEQARCTGGIVISNDKFRDHIKASDLKSFKEVIKKRVCRYEIVKSHEFNRNMLNEKYYTGFNIHLLCNTQADFFCPFDDDNIEVVVYIRSCRTPQQTMRLRKELDVMADFIQQELCSIYEVNAPALDYFDPKKNKLTTFEMFRKLAQNAGYFISEEEEIDLKKFNKL